MSDIQVVLSPRAKQRLEEIADYLYKQNVSNSFVVSYLDKIHSWLQTLLIQFPESGILMPEFGKGILRVVYCEYSFIYRINIKDIEILTIYRENLP